MDTDGWTIARFPNFKDLSVSSVFPCSCCTCLAWYCGPTNQFRSCLFRRFYLRPPLLQMCQLCIGDRGPVFLAAAVFSAEVRRSFLTRQTFVSNNMSIALVTRGSQRSYGINRCLNPPFLSPGDPTPLTKFSSHRKRCRRATVASASRFPSLPPCRGKRARNYEFQHVVDVAARSSGRME